MTQIVRAMIRTTYELIRREGTRRTRHHLREYTTATYTQNLNTMAITRESNRLSFYSLVLETDPCRQAEGNDLSQARSLTRYV